MAGSLISLNLEVPQEPHDLTAAHRHCTRNREELTRSSLCGCFYCLAIYSPQDITEWTDDGQTAICAKCPVDSVVGSASGLPITRTFLEQMYERWF